LTTLDPAAIQDAARSLAESLPDSSASREISNLLIATGRAADPAAIETACNRFGDLLEQTLEVTLRDAVEIDEEYLADLRRFFLDPPESHSICELAALWRIPIEDARDLYPDGSARAEASAGAAGSEDDVARIDWPSATTAAALSGLLRSFDVERALGLEFVKTRTAEPWRTVPVLIRIPRFVADAIGSETSIPRTLPAAHRIERLLIDIVRNHLTFEDRMRPRPEEDV
jgi:hypothetical protein